MKSSVLRKTKRKIIALFTSCLASVFLICTPVCAAESVVGITFDGSDSPYVVENPTPTPIPTPNPNPNPPKKEENKTGKEDEENDDKKQDTPQESNDDKSDEPSPLLGSENTTHMGVTVTAVSETEYETLTEEEIVSSEKEEKFDAVNTIGEKIIVINKNLFGTATTTRFVDDDDTTGEIKNVSEIISHFLTEEDIEAYNNGSEIAIVLNISDSVPILEEDNTEFKSVPKGDYFEGQLALLKQLGKPDAYIRCFEETGDINKADMLYKFRQEHGEDVSLDDIEIAENRNKIAYLDENGVAIIDKRDIGAYGDEFPFF